MNRTELVRYVTAIIAKADTPEQAAEALVDGGFCTVVDLEDQIAELWQTVAVAERVHLTWSPTSARVACGRHSAIETTLSAALIACRVAAASWTHAPPRDSTA